MSCTVPTSSACNASTMSEDPKKLRIPIRRVTSVSAVDRKENVPMASVVIIGGNIQKNQFQVVTMATSTSRMAPVATTPRAWNTVPTEANMAAYV